MAKKEAAADSGKAKKKKKKGSFTTHILLAMTIALGFMFIPTAVVLMIGLMPMFAAFFVAGRKNKTKVVTVGAMNFAGCMPFLMELWQSDGDIDKALSIILDPMAIIVIYSAAGLGYIIDWGLTLMVAAFLYQRGTARKDAIEKRKAELIKRWGEEVNGKIQLDREGFPIVGME